LIPEWLSVTALISLVGAFLCALYLAGDVIRRPQPMAVMNFVWPITGLYLGPLAIWWYLTLARPRKMRMGDSMQSESRPFWKGIIVDTTHCGAGCALGDIISEFAIFFGALTLAGSTLWAEYAGDFALAFFFGIIFQYFAIAPMRHLKLLPGLRAAVQADAISLTAFEIGLFFVMYLMTLLPFHEQLNPLVPTFWFLMQIGMAVGYVTSYPANWFLVRAGIKQPM
jgi:hypothetical protein